MAVSQKVLAALNRVKKALSDEAKALSEMDCYDLFSEVESESQERRQAILAQRATRSARPAAQVGD